MFYHFYLILDSYYNFHIQPTLIDLSHDMLLMASGCSIYLHKLWSSDAQKFASTVASNPRTQRKFVWSIAQMQRFPIPSQSLLIKGN